MTVVTVGYYDIVSPLRLLPFAVVMECKTGTENQFSPTAVNLSCSVVHNFCNII